jgi:hypothetical protein
MPTKRRVDRSRLGFWTGFTMDPRVTLRRQVPPWEKRVVLATFGSLGDLHPFIAVAKALQPRA